MPRKAQSKTSSAPTTPVLNPHAAGIDVGATIIYVAVPPDRDPDPVRSFGTFTQDLLALAHWLRKCGIRTVAMEATGVYWIPLFQILEERGLEVCLVNARHVKHVPGRKSDVADCQWLQYLHAVGLLRGSFHPPQAVRAVRALLRHRDSLVKMAASHVQHMQKALTQMNLQLHQVISDITGQTGLAILDAVLAGERDPEMLAQLRHPGIKASRETIARSLQGDWRPEHLFTLRQALEAYRYYQHLLAECDGEMERQLQEFDSKLDPDAPADPPRKRTIRGNQPRFASLDLATELHRILGVDLTRVPGLDTLTIYTFFSEVGPDLTRFPRAGHFASWLGLCPDNRVSGGKVLSVRTRKVKSRMAEALRMAAYTLSRSHSALGDYYRRMRARLGAPKAITAAAHKLARIIYHLVTAGQEYNESVFADNEERYRQRRTRRLEREAAALGYSLVPREPAGQPVS
ncbi:MAG TPA: IS110 family transposase [Dehalococcoidia bacterium]|nr:IS110 family transposase [Dehalococcoidia bacterium]